MMVQRSGMGWRRGIAVSALAGLLAAGPALAAGDSLAQDMTSRLEKEGYAVQQEGRDQLRLKRDGKDVGMVDLGNLREICSKQPQSCETQKQRRVGMQREAQDKTNAKLAPQEVRVIVRPDGYRAAIENQMRAFAQGKSAEEKRKIAEALPMLRDLGPGFVIGWAQDSANGISPISATQMKEAGLTAADLERLGGANLRHEKVDTLQSAGDKFPGVFVSHGNDYLSNVLVDDAFWRRVAGAQADNAAAACLPARHELFVYVPALDPQRRVDFDNLCRRLAQNAAPAFSDRVVRRKDGRWLFN